MKMKFYKNLKTIALTAGLFLATSAMADPIVELADKKTNYIQTETGYVLNFELSATAAELEDIKLNISKLSDRIKMTTELITDNKYKVIYTIDHQNQPEYVFKMMLTSGFKGITHKGESHSLNKIVDILYSYQD
jgi:hypothetical protein